MTRFGPIGRSAMPLLILALLVACARSPTEPAGDSLTAPGARPTTEVAESGSPAAPNELSPGGSPPGGPPPGPSTPRGPAPAPLARPAPPPEPKPIAWIPIGPADVDSPGADVRAYARIQRALGDLSKAPEERIGCVVNTEWADERPQGPFGELYQGLGYACLERWDEAAANLAAVKDADFSGDTECLAVEARRLLGALVAAHRARPGEFPRVVAAPRNDQACAVHPWTEQSDDGEDAEAEETTDAEATEP